MLTAAIVEDLNSLEQFRQQWDRLAVAARAPYCSPAWMWAWWRHAAPSRASLRTVVVADAEELYGVAPLYVERLRGGFRRYRLLGTGTSSRVDFIARPGHQPEIGRLFAGALAGAQPSPSAIVFDGIPVESPWPSLLRASWPGTKPRLLQGFTVPSPTLSIGGRSYEEWLSSKSPNFRQQMRRRMRQLEESGVRFQMYSSAAEAGSALGAFAQLHHSRWDQRGGSRVLRPGVERMLREVAQELEGRMKIVVLTTDEETVASMVFLQAGGELAWWLGGFHHGWAGLQPGVMALFATVRAAFEEGLDRIDFGVGDQAFKRRFAENEDLVRWVSLVPHVRNVPLARLQHLWPLTRVALARRLSPRGKRALRRAVTQLRRNPGSSR